MSAPALRAVDLHKSFRTAKGPLEVLRGVSLEIPRGQFAAIQGASGSGKSTLLSLLAGLDRPTTGAVTLDGERLDGRSESDLARIRREKVGFLFQAFHLVPSLSVMENVLLPQAFQRGVFTPETARELLDRVGLSDRADFFPEQLSGGERQRAALARALINNPPVLFADEPTGNLDSGTGRRVLDLLEEHVRGAGRTLVLITHDDHVAARADRRFHLSDGRLADGPLKP